MWWYQSRNHRNRWLLPKTSRYMNWRWRWVGQSRRVKKGLVVLISLKRSIENRLRITIAGCRSITTWSNSWLLQRSSVRRQGQCWCLLHQKMNDWRPSWIVSYQWGINSARSCSRQSMSRDNQVNSKSTISNINTKPSALLIPHW